MTMPSISWCGSISISGRSLRGAGLALVARCRGRISASAISLGTKLHFMPGGESRAAAPAQVRFLHFVDDLLGRHLLQRFFERLIAVVLQIDVDFVRIGHAEALADHRNFVGIASCNAPEITGTGCGLLACLKLLENRVDFVGVEIFVEIVVHLHGWRAGAGAHAFDFFERKHAGLGETSLLPMPRRFLTCSKSSLPPRSMQEIFVQTWT